MRRLLLCFFICFSWVSHAEEVTDLYQTLVPVPDQTSISREAGINRAFAKVVTKLTGNSKVMQWPQLQPFLTDPRAFLNAVGFQDLSNQDNADRYSTGLEVSFDQQIVDKLIRQAQLPILPANRPTMLVWIIADDISYGRRFINQPATEQNLNDSYSTQLLSALDDVMGDRGIPYFLPSYDLQDQLSLSLDQAWSMNADLLTMASQRYEADGWFVIRLYTASNGEIRGAWFYENSGIRQLNDFRGDDIGAVIGSAVNDVLDDLLAFYTYVPQLDTDQLLVQIDAVSSFAQYQSVIALFKKLQLVNSVQLFAIEGEQLVLAIEIEGRADRLHADLLRSGRLQSQILSDQRSIGRLTYTWVAE